MFLSLLTYKNYDLDLEKVLTMALIHDFGESIIGDITPKNNHKYKNKAKYEDEAIKNIFSKLPESSEYIELWKDFEYSRTNEGMFLKQIDKLEMALQAIKYDNEFEIDLSEFLNSAIKDISTEELLQFINLAKKFVNNYNKKQD